MASFQIQALKTTEVLDSASFIPTTITQNQSFYGSDGNAFDQATTVTRKMSVSNLRSWFDSGIYKQIRSGPSTLVSPENFTTTGTINFHQPGLVALYGGLTAPNGWLLCDGASYSTTSPSGYPYLFGVLGYSYGGSGSTFKVPNLIGRTVFGVDSMGGTPVNRITDSVLYGTIGAETVALTKEQSPFVGHNHPTYNGNYSQTYGLSHQGDHGTSDPENVLGSPDGNLCFGQVVTIEQTEVATAAAHNNLPPYLNLTWIIKT
jgi:microcystin-dependent protein